MEYRTPIIGILQLLHIYIIAFPVVNCVIAARASSLDFSIEENHPPGTLIGYIQGTDQSREILPPYTIYSTSSEAIDHVRRDLDISLASGAIRVGQNSLDREIRSSYQFLAIGVDGSGVRVTINVKDVNDYAPTFPDQFLVINISESSPPNLVRYFIGNAIDLDSGENGTVRYEIISGNDDDMFSLSAPLSSSLSSASSIFRSLPQTAPKRLELTTTGFLDYETTPAYSLVIRAYDGGIPYRTGDICVNVTIIDANDNRPVFTHSRYVVGVSEDATEGTLVLRVHAIDEDSGENGRVTYLIDRTRSDVSGQFIVDPVDGSITVHGQLDFETIPTYELIIVASDNGPGSGLRSSAIVSIIIEDINDNAPTIHVTYLTMSGDGRVARNAARKGDFLARIILSDPEEDRRTRDLVPGDEGECNNIAVTLLNDHGMFALKSVQKNEFVIVLAVLPPAYSFTQVTSNRSSSDIIPLRISSSLLPSFSSPPSTVALSQGNDLSPDVQYQVVISAVDCGKPPLTSTAALVIVISNGITDIDEDISLQFSHSIYEVTTHELLEPGSIIVAVVANVTGLNSNCKIPNVVYSLLDSPGAPAATHHRAMSSTLFKIDSQTGVITARDVIVCSSSKQADNIKLVVAAAVISDDETCKMVAVQETAEVIVRVRNEHSRTAPIFERSYYEFVIPDDVKVDECFATKLIKHQTCTVFTRLESRLEFGTMVILRSVDFGTGDLVTMSAIDLDCGAEAEMDYTLDDVETGQRLLNSSFKIKQDGRLCLASRLETTRRTSYDFYVIAKHPNGHEAKSYLRLLHNRSTVNNSSNSSKLHNNYVNSSFLSNCRLLFPSSFVTLYVRENTPTAAAIFIARVDCDDVTRQSLAPHDAGRDNVTHDESTTRDDVEYFLSNTEPVITGASVDASVDDQFIVERQSGVLRSRHGLDFERRSFYRLTINATVHGDIKTTTSMVIELRVLDANDNRPIFTRSSYVCTAFIGRHSTNQTGRRSICRVQAKDRESSVEYFIESEVDANGVISLDRREGTVHFRPLAQLGEEGMRSRYEAVIIAVDKGRPAYFTRAILVVIVRHIKEREEEKEDNNDVECSAPDKIHQKTATLQKEFYIDAARFPTEGFVFYISGSARVGDVVGAANVVDSHGFPCRNVMYSISDVTEHFTINSTTAVISVISDLKSLQDGSVTAVSRVKRSIIDFVFLTVVADSMSNDGNWTLATPIRIEVDRSCAGCERIPSFLVIPQELTNGISYVHWLLIVLCITSVIAAGVVVAIIVILRRNRRRRQCHKGELTKIPCSLQVKSQVICQDDVITPPPPPISPRPRLTLSRISNSSTLVFSVNDDSKMMSSVKKCDGPLVGFGSYQHRPLPPLNRTPSDKASNIHDILSNGFDSLDRAVHIEDEKECLMSKRTGAQEMNVASNARQHNFNQPFAKSRSSNVPYDSDDLSIRIAANHREYLPHLGIDVDGLEKDGRHRRPPLNPTFPITPLMAPLIGCSLNRFGVASDPRFEADSEPAYASVLNIQDVFDEISRDFRHLVTTVPTFARFSEVFVDLAAMRDDHKDEIVRWALPVRQRQMISSGSLDTDLSMSMWLRGSNTTMPRDAEDITTPINYSSREVLSSRSNPFSSNSLIRFQ